MPRWWEAMAPRKKSRAWCRCTAVGRDRAERDGVGARCDRQGGSSIFTRSEMRLGKESGLEDTCSVFRKLIGRAVAASVLSHCQAVEEALILAVSERVPKRLTERRERRAARRVPPLAHRTSRHGAVPTWSRAKLRSVGGTSRQGGHGQRSHDRVHVRRFRTAPVGPFWQSAANVANVDSWL